MLGRQNSLAPGNQCAGRLLDRENWLPHDKQQRMLEAEGVNSMNAAAVICKSILWIPREREARSKSL